MTSGTMDRGEVRKQKEWEPEQELYCKRRAEWVRVEGTDRRAEL